jgi:hypothetical protein
MPGFTSHTDYWKFARSVRRVSRHVLEPQSRDFLDALVATSEARVQELLEKRVFWRAQRGNHWDFIEEIDDQVPSPHKPGRMKPLEDKAREGRVNPKGIPCLYLSDDRDTAMSEVRPWIGANVSVGEFILLKTLRVVNCSIDGKPKILFDEPPPDQLEKQLWAHVNRAFSAPVTESDDEADYAPNQIIAEAFRMHGCDGLAYRSSLGTGLNFALFNPSDADLVNCRVFTASDVTFKFDEIANPYYITKYYPEIPASAGDVATLRFNFRDDDEPEAGELDSEAH